MNVILQARTQRRTAWRLPASRSIPSTTRCSSTPSTCLAPFLPPRPSWAWCSLLWASWSPTCPRVVASAPRPCPTSARVRELISICHLYFFWSIKTVVPRIGKESIKTQCGVPRVHRFIYLYWGLQTGRGARGSNATYFHRQLAVQGFSGRPIFVATPPISRNELLIII